MRARSLGATLTVAREAARACGVTRLADCTGLDTLGIPTFQAVRPSALSLSVSQGKGLTPMAAMVSALIEAVETCVAERLRPSGGEMSLAVMGGRAEHIWRSAPRAPLATRVERGRSRSWMTGHDMRSGAPVPIPFDILSLDLTRATPPDVQPSTAGLASGNSLAEARVGALAELLEHDFDAHWRDLPPKERRASEVDLASIDDPLVAATLSRIGATGRSVRMWSIGQPWGAAAFFCVICDEMGCDTALVPAGGSGCHVDRRVAALRAILEAAQTRVTLIAGARDDLTIDEYADPARQKVELLLALMSFTPGPLSWSTVPTQPGAQPEAAIDALLTIAERRTALPVIEVRHESPHPELHIVQMVCPGLSDPDRRRRKWRYQPPPPAPAVLRSRHFPRRLIFVGPTLAGCRLPPTIEFRPPAQAGDIAALLSDPPEAVGLIDGCFESAPSVWHKELMDLIASGVAVFGAASLGALRAAELGEFGMRGVGAIFEGYRDGHLRRDDAVMVTHAPAELGYRPLTIALVDAEAALLMTPMPVVERRMLQRIVRTTSFRQRSWPHCLDVFRRRTGRDATPTASALAAAPSLKQYDALRLVQMFEGALPPQERTARPPLTSFYRLIIPAI